MLERNFEKAIEFYKLNLEVVTKLEDKSGKREFEFLVFVEDKS